MISSYKANEWMTSGYLVPNEIIEIKSLLNENGSSLKEAFYKDLEFGTGGLRGIIGIGTNRINRFTIRKATQGVSNQISKICGDKLKKAVVAYDTRNYSKEFALETALVFAANGFKTYLFADVTPTPILSFAVRFLKADVGVVITASHNPKEYNGYKVYNSLGGQITLELAHDFEQEIKRLNPFDDVKIISENESKNSGLLNYVDNLIYKAYYEKVLNFNERPGIGIDLSIVYTPIHGSGLKHVKNLIDSRGYKLKIVKEQSNFDGTFPTVKYPNPEEESALYLAVKLATKIDADIVLGTDPDADRVGVAVKHNGSYKYLTGNEIGVLLLNHIASKRKVNESDYVIKTIVTSDLGKEIARKNGASVIETLTGFKFIGEKIQELVDDNKNFLFGYEESYGFLKDSFVRDKDALMSSLLICDMASFYKKQNKTLIDVLDEIYKEFGYYSNILSTITFGGVDGIEKMNLIIKTLISRVEKINALNPYSFLRYYENYNTRLCVDLLNNNITSLKFPSANVIKFIFNDNSWIVVRPSGTEPKLKIYIQSISNSKEKSLSLIERLDIGIKKLLNN